MKRYLEKLWRILSEYEYYTNRYFVSYKITIYLKIRR